MTQKVTVTFLVGFTSFMTSKGHRDLKGRHDLLYDPKRLRWPLGWFDLFMTPKGRRVIRGSRDLLYDPKGHDDLFDRGLFFDPKRSQGP